MATFDYARKPDEHGEHGAPEHAEHAETQEGAAPVPVAGIARVADVDPADPMGGQSAPEDVVTALRRRRGAGSPLPAGMADSFGAELGTDLSGVRVHTGGEAKKLTKAVDAAAFTYGNDVYLGSDSVPSGSGGQRLLAHELAHVAQHHGGMSSAGSGGTTIGRANDAAEVDADKRADAALAGLRSGRQADGEAGGAGAASGEPGSLHRFSLGSLFGSAATSLISGIGSVLGGLGKAASGAGTANAGIGGALNPFNAKAGGIESLIQGGSSSANSLANAPNTMLQSGVKAVANVVSGVQTTKQSVQDTVGTVTGMPDTLKKTVNDGAVTLGVSDGKKVIKDKPAAETTNEAEEGKTEGEAGEGTQGAEGETEEKVENETEQEGAEGETEEKVENETEQEGAEGETEEKVENETEQGGGEGETEEKVENETEEGGGEGPAAEGGEGETEEKVENEEGGGEGPAAEGGEGGGPAAEMTPEKIDGLAQQVDDDAELDQMANGELEGDVAVEEPEFMKDLADSTDDRVATYKARLAKYTAALKWMKLGEAKDKKPIGRAKALRELRGDSWHKSMKGLGYADMLLFVKNMRWEILDKLDPNKAPTAGKGTDSGEQSAVTSESTSTEVEGGVLEKDDDDIDTGSAQTVTGETTWASFAVSDDVDELHVLDASDMSDVKLTDLVGGETPKMAGKIKISSGLITHVDISGSGTQPDAEFLIRWFHALEEQGMGWDFTMTGFTLVPDGIIAADAHDMLVNSGGSGKPTATDEGSESKN
jgi:hypothetical protein